VFRESFAQRGAVIVEFVLSALVLFTVMFGALELGVVGLEQIKADGAAFTTARQDAFGVTGPGASSVLVPNTYPGVTADQISSTPLPLPSTGVVGSGGSTATSSEPVDYDLGNTSSRHGGFSVVQPTQIVANVVRPLADNLLLGLTGSTLTGFAVEPQFQEVGLHSDVGGTGLDSGATFANRNDYFSYGDNTPPYFVGFKYMEYCINLASDCNNSNAASPFVDTEALGLAEFLDDDNWSRSTNGVTPVPNGSAAPTAVFAEMMAHQQVFATIASDLAARAGSAAPTSIPQAAMFGPAGTIAAYLNPLPGAGGDPKIQCIYQKWDVLVTAQYALGTPVESAGDPYEFHPATNCLS
jgi:hypothetical protein